MGCEFSLTNTVSGVSHKNDGQFILYDKIVREVIQLLAWAVTRNLSLQGLVRVNGPFKAGLIVIQWRFRLHTNIHNQGS